jgi:hypothetical protein
MRSRAVNRVEGTFESSGPFIRSALSHSHVVHEVVHAARGADIGSNTVGSNGRAANCSRQASLIPRPPWQGARLSYDTHCLNSPEQTLIPLRGVLLAAGWPLPPSAKEDSRPDEMEVPSRTKIGPRLPVNSTSRSAWPFFLAVMRPQHDAVLSSCAACHD